VRVSRGRCASSVRLELEREESRSARLAEACVRLQLCMITCGVFGPGSDSTSCEGQRVSKFWLFLRATIVLQYCVWMERGDARARGARGPGGRGGDAYGYAVRLI
jgi:hypothetical protein